MEIKKTKIIRAIEQKPIVLGYPIDKVAILSMLLLTDFLIVVRSLWFGLLFFLFILALVYLYLKGFLEPEKLFYQKFRYLVFNQQVKIQKVNNK